MLFATSPRVRRRHAIDRQGKRLVEDGAKTQVLHPRLAGMPDKPIGDGRYSLNGDDFASLPGAQTDKRLIGTNG